jgi:restriction endonuclease S subunit
MIEKVMKPGWKVWRFDQIATNVNVRIDNPSESGMEYYVGLEHLDADSLKIRRWGTPDDVEATKLMFKKGDIIFGRRRAYQRKLGVAEFDGICSAHAMVLRAKPEVVVPDFLPFFMQSDSFMNRAVQISVGSLSPTINWKNLAQQEFVMPPIAEQRSVIIVFSSLQSSIDSLEELQTSLRNLYYATIDSEYDFGCRVRSASLESITSRISDGVHKKPDYVDAGVPFLVVENLTRGTGIDLSETRFISNKDHEEFTKRTKPARGDVLVSKDGTLGVARVIETDTEFSIFVSLALLKPIRDVLDGYYLRYFFDTSHFRRRIGQKTSGSAILHIHLTDFRKTTLPLPSLSEQRVIAEEIRRIESSIERTNERIASAKALAKKLQNNYFGS